MMIITRVSVAPDGTISGRVSTVPAGEHEARIIVEDKPDAPRAATPSGPEPDPLDWLPVHDLGPWPEGLVVDRDWIYQDGECGSLDP